MLKPTEIFRLLDVLPRCFYWSKNIRFPRGYFEARTDTALGGDAAGAVATYFGEPSYRGRESVW